jgi:pimeloyl-ACP methyl ester carboxylesterase
MIGTRFGKDVRRIARRSGAIRGLLIAGLMALSATARSEVIPVEPIEKGFFISSAPSLTFHWPGSNPRALLVFVPGGEGVIGLRPGQTDNRSPFLQMLRRLSDPTLTSGRFDVVLMDSPAPLSPRQPFPVARTSSEHLMRIESVVRFYQARTGLPVWLMGHSNGGISIAEFARYLQKKGTPELVAGFISSSSRSEAEFEPPFAAPMLVIHHRNDGCRFTLYASAEGRHARVKSFDPAPVEFFTVTEGAAQGADPCSSGFHMYAGAAEQVSAAIDDFLMRNTRDRQGLSIQGGIQ